MNHKRFFQLFDSILLIAVLVLSIMFFKSSFEKTFNIMAEEPTGVELSNDATNQDIEDTKSE